MAKKNKFAEVTAFAADLNPVACLILQVLLEDIPRHGPALADELRSVGREIKEAAATELAQLYPPDPDGMRPIAYLWARTILCESPNCGAEIPLIRSFWLSKRAGRKRPLRCSVVRSGSQPPCIEFEIFEPASDSDVRSATVSRAAAAASTARGASSS
jgi:adenine-specific DNA methylase